MFCLRTAREKLFLLIKSENTDPFISKFKATRVTCKCNFTILRNLARQSVFSDETEEEKTLFCSSSLQPSFTPKVFLVRTNLERVLFPGHSLGRLRKFLFELREMLEENVFRVATCDNSNGRNEATVLIRNEKRDRECV